jgi:hypothetical protein
LRQLPKKINFSTNSGVAGSLFIFKYPFIFIKLQEIWQVILDEYRLLFLIAVPYESYCIILESAFWLRGLFAEHKDLTC